MWTNNKTYSEDLDYICGFNNSFIKALDGSVVMVTGATGLIGQTLVNSLLFENYYSDNAPTVIAAVRNTDKAGILFKAQMDEFPGKLRIVPGDITEPFDIEGPVDYIIHGASQTSSRGFIETPVETISTAYNGTVNVLELARRKQVKGMVFLSTMEVYGYPQKGHKVAEDEIGALTPLTVRNCYPVSKQLCENLCCSYAHEYKVPVKIMRLTQTFGPGVVYNDGRVFAEFARCIIEKKDIVLKTAGLTERCYLYTADAATAIFTGLISGDSGQAYNAANEESYCSIAQMARMAAEMGGTKVKIESADTSALGYAGTLYMDLDTSMLRSLGWKAETGLKDMYLRMISCMEKEEAHS